MLRQISAGVIAGVLLGHGGVAADAVPMTFEDLRELIEREQLRDPAAVVARLPSDLRRNYTLAYQSQSLQESDYDNPRAILFGSDARLVITFNGHPTQRHYHSLEVLHFREREQRFELRSIDFSTGKAVFSPPNPALCRNCHGHNPRPIWGSYEYEVKDAHHWPGFYGSIHDAPQLRAGEAQAFERFRVRARTHPRYRHLQLSHPESAWYPYGQGAYQHRFRPNNRLGNLLARLNARKIAAELNRSPFLEAYPNTAMLWLLQCPQAATAEFAQHVDGLWQRRFPRRRHDGLYSELKAVAAENRLAFQFEKLLSGLDIYTWNMSVTTLPRGKRFFTGIVSIDQLVAAALLREPPRLLAWLRPYYRPWDHRALYDTFRAGYYRTNVAPGGIGAQYDRLGLYFDPAAAARACDPLSERARAEVTAAGSGEHGDTAQQAVVDGLTQRMDRLFPGKAVAIREGDDTRRRRAGETPHAQ